MADDRPEVLLTGLLFYDLGLTGLGKPPTPGEEIWTTGMLSLLRAPTDNDELGGMALRWRAWGLDTLVRKVVSVRRDGGLVTVDAEYDGTVGVVRHRQVFTPV